MTAKTTTPATVGVDDRGQESVTFNQNSTTAWHLRQLVKIALPWIAAIVTSTRYTDRKSRFLDRLLVLAEGGRYD
jgi:hypothetical protein